jgi:hypothetical protein
MSENKTWQREHTFVHVETLGLHKMLKFIFLCLETYANMTFHACISYCATQNIKSQTEGNVVNQTGRNWASVAKYVAL